MQDQTAKFTVTTTKQDHPLEGRMTKRFLRAIDSDKRWSGLPSDAFVFTCRTAAELAAVWVGGRVEEAAEMLHEAGE